MTKHKHAEDVSANKCKPHVHAETIKAWADGAEIEFYSKNQCKWLRLRNDEIGWHPDYQYRVKHPVKTYGEIARDAWFVCRQPFQSSGDWEEVSHAVIEAYKERNGLSKAPINDYTE